MVDGATSLHASLAAGTDEIACPHCGASNAKLPGLGAIVDCRQCDRSFAQPRPPVPSRAARGPGSSLVPIRSPTDVGLRISGAVSVVLTVLFYAAVVEPLSGSYLADLFNARGWVPYATAWLSVWAGVLLVLKARLLAHQRRALELDWLPDAIASRITPGNAAGFATHVRDLESELPRPAFAGLLGSGVARSLLAARLESALERFRLRASAGDVSEHLGGQAQLDAGAVESSYTMVRVFIWAIPLLGFIGTVIGISAAVAGFSDSVAVAVDLDVMKESIGSVTTGLAVAFDTTLLALVMSIAIMFPASSLQKAEEEFLSRVEAYCDERLARRLDDRAATAANGLDALHVQLARLADTLSSLDAKLHRGS